MKNIKFHNPMTYAEKLYYIDYRVNQKMQELFPSYNFDYKIMTNPIKGYVPLHKRKYKNLRIVK